MISKFITTHSKHPLVREGTWVAVGTVISVVAQILGTRLITQFASPSVFGTVSLLLGTMLLARHLAATPLLQSQSRLYSDCLQRDELFLLRQVISQSLCYSVGLAVLITIIFGIFIAKRMNTSIYTFIWLAGVFAAEAFRLYEVGFLQIARRQKESSIVSILEAILRPLSIVLMLFVAGTSVAAFLAGQMLPMVLSLIGLYILIRRESPAKQEKAIAKEDRQRIFREVWLYALPLVPAAIVGWTTNLGGRYVLAQSLGIAEVGVYAAMYGAMNTPIMLLHGIVLQTFRPIYFDAVATNQKAKEKRIFRIMLLLTIGYGTCAIVGAALFHRWLAWLLFAETYRYASYLMPWIAAGSSLLVLSYVFEARIYARKRTGKLLIGLTIGAIASVIITYILIRHFGMRGAGWACPAYYAIQMFSMMMLSQAKGRNLEEKPQDIIYEKEPSAVSV